MSMGAQRPNVKTVANAYQYFTDPLSAIVTIDSLGHIVIDGSKTTWRYNVIPSNDGKNGCEPFITSGTYDVLE